MKKIASFVDVTDKLEKVCELPGGFMLYVQKNGAGGRSYYSDEIGDGVLIYDTCLHGQGSILTALAVESAFADEEARARHRDQR